MKSRHTKMKTRKNDSNERTAWSVRLAFGIYQESENIAPTISEKSESTFQVMP